MVIYLRFRICPAERFFSSKVQDWLKQIGSSATSVREVLDQDCPKVSQTPSAVNLAFFASF